MNYSVGVVILNYNNYQDTINCVSDSFSKQQGIDLEIVIIDNASTNDSVDKLKNKFNNIKNVKIIVAERNLGYASGNNVGLKYLANNNQCDYIIVANNDIELNDERMINKLISEYGKLEKAAFAAPLMIENNKISRNTAWKLPKAMSEILSSTFCSMFLFSHYLKKYSYDFNKCKTTDMAVDCVSGSFFIGAREIFEKLDYFDEGTFLYYEESILGKKVKQANLNNYIIKNLSYNHKWSKSINAKYTTSEKFALRLDSKLYYWKKYGNKGAIFLSLLKLLHYFNTVEITIITFYKKLRDWLVNKPRVKQSQTDIG